MDLAQKVNEQKKAMYTWFNGFGRGDIEYAYSRFAEDATWLGIGKDFKRYEYVGKAEIVPYQSTWVNKIWSGGLHFTPLHVVGDGSVVISEWTDEGVASSTGETYRNRGVNVFEFDDAVDGGLTVVRGRTYFDLEPLFGDSIARFNEEGIGVVAS